MKTKKLPSCAKKGSKEKDSFYGVVLVGVAILGWPVIIFLRLIQGIEYVLHSVTIEKGPPHNCLLHKIEERNAV